MAPHNSQLRRAFVPTAAADSRPSWTSSAATRAEASAVRKALRVLQTGQPASLSATVIAAARRRLVVHIAALALASASTQARLAAVSTSAAGSATNVAAAGVPAAPCPPGTPRPFAKLLPPAHASRRRTTRTHGACWHSGEPTSRPRCAPVRRAGVPWSGAGRRRRRTTRTPRYHRPP